MVFHSHMHEETIGFSSYFFMRGPSELHLAFHVICINYRLHIVWTHQRA